MRLTDAELRETIFWATRAVVLPNEIHLVLIPKRENPSRETRELDAKVCVRNLDTAHFSLAASLLAHRSPTSPKVAELQHTQAGSGAAEWWWTHPIRKTPQCRTFSSATPETRYYLNIAETSNRSRLAMKTIYNWISLGRHMFGL